MLDREQVFKLLHERHAVQRRFARATFGLWQRLGLHVVGDHFYDPIPNTKMIEADYIDGPRDLPGLSVDWSSLSTAARALIGTYLEEYLRDRDRFGYREFNYYFYGLDALYYYSLLRERRPRRVIEIGQGFSTRIALAALAHVARTGGGAPELVSIDPYARYIPPPVEGIEFSIVTKTLQQVGRDLPLMLEAGDLLFVDSSHIVKFGSDVKLLFEQVYPCLRPGVIVHIHDIFTPYDYPAEWMLKRKQFWNEQYFLEGFLSHNKDFRVEAAMHHLVRDEEIDRMLTERGQPYETIRREGASFYLSRVS